MQLTRLSMILEECTRDLADEGATQVEGFYHHKNAWWNAQTKVAVAAGVSAELAQCLKTNGPYRSKHSKISNFALPQIQAVIRAAFGAPIRQQRLSAIQRIVQRSYRNASNAFEVKYNPMTGLLAKEAFHQLVGQQLKALADFDRGDKELRADESNPPALCVLALDIDHFKQVNDSFGHAYGDTVIRAFAVRIEQAVAEFCNNSAAKVQATCAHVSGEEFFCIAWGKAETREFESLAHSVLEAVRDPGLPTDEEAQLVSKVASGHELELPPIVNRNVTCSIGGVISGVPTSRDAQVSVTKLLNQADLALYKSKNQGRNRATFFPAILQNGGRVLQHRAEVSACVVDIGSEVGVMKGQEFLVFHPEFTGHSPYVLDDGRSKKVLGRFPKIPLCTITAFDVQRSISFCRPSEDSLKNIVIPENASLEAIPLGTLAVAVAGPGIVHSAEESIGNVVSIADTLARISGDVGADSAMSFAVIGIRNESQLLTDHGPAAVNRSLAVACRQLQKISEFEFLGQVEATKLLIQFASFGVPQRQQLEEALQRAEKENGSRATFVAGVYAPNFGRGKEEAEMPKLTSLKARVDLARYAASPEGVIEKVRVHVFTYNSANYVLSRLRELREFERALADYEHFSKLGITGQWLDNSAGLAAYSSGKLALAEAFFLKAADKAPASEILFRLNAITAQVRQGNITAAVRTAEFLDDEALEKKYRDHRFGIICLATALAEHALVEAEQATPSISKAIVWAKRALEFNDPIPAYENRLKAALEKLELVNR